MGWGTTECEEVLLQKSLNTIALVKPRGFPDRHGLLQRRGREKMGQDSGAQAGGICQQGGVCACVTTRLPYTAHLIWVPVPFGYSQADESFPILRGLDLRGVPGSQDEEGSGCSGYPESPANSPSGALPSFPESQADLFCQGWMSVCFPALPTLSWRERWCLFFCCWPRGRGLGEGGSPRGSPVVLSRPLVTYLGERHSVGLTCLSSRLTFLLE